MMWCSHRSFVGHRNTACIKQARSSLRMQTVRGGEHGAAGHVLAVVYLPLMAPLPSGRASMTAPDSRMSCGEPEVEGAPPDCMRESCVCMTRTSAACCTCTSPHCKGVHAWRRCACKHGLHWACRSAQIEEEGWPCREGAHRVEDLATMRRAAVFHLDAGGGRMQLMLRGPRAGTQMILIGRAPLRCHTGQHVRECVGVQRGGQRSCLCCGGCCPYGLQ